VNCIMPQSCLRHGPVLITKRRRQALLPISTGPHCAHVELARPIGCVCTPLCVQAGATTDRDNCACIYTGGLTHVDEPREQNRREYNPLSISESFRQSARA